MPTQRSYLFRTSCLVSSIRSPLSRLATKLSTLGMQSAQEDLQKKNQELNDLYRDKNNKLSQMTNLYNLLKARAMRSRMQTAASDTVSQALNLLPSLNAPPSVSVARSAMSPTLPAQVSQHLKTQSYPVDAEGVEQLHRHQRSGTGSSKRARTKTPNAAPMLPPAKPNWNGRFGMYWR
jgi:E3 ubiquitin-protein ligase CCNP1IP1